jgi:hypothetical protein
VAKAGHINNGVIQVADIHSYPPELRAKIDEGVIEVELVPTGAVLQDRIDK